MQNPHWHPPASWKLSASWSRTSLEKPSIVSIRRPCSLGIFITHESRGWPSTRTVQQPQCPCGSQPLLGEVIPKSSRRTLSSDRCGSVVTLTGAPFKMNETVTSGE